MNDKLDRTQKLGDAFLAQEKDVLAAVQRLRARQRVGQSQVERAAEGHCQAGARACWATLVTLHAIISMPDPERELILLRTILQGGQQTENPAGGQTTPPSGVPSPASAQPPPARLHHRGRRGRLSELHWVWIERRRATSADKNGFPARSC
jgi:Protein of unknown function (DUF3300)